jgi:hypothetical protein
MSVDREALDRFGRLLIGNVRDATISQVDWILRPSESATGFLKWLRGQIASACNDEQKEIIRYLIPWIVDNVLHSLLYSLEACDWIDVKVTTDSGAERSLRGLGDGMHGDLFDWIPEYSQERKDWLEDFDRF